MNRDSNWSANRRNKKNNTGTKCSSDDVANCRSKHEVMESGSGDYKEIEKKYW